MSDEPPRTLRESIRQLNVVSSRLQNLRALLATERNTPAEQSRAREAFEQEMADMAQDESRSIAARASQLRSNERRRPYISLPSESPDAARVPSPTPSGPVPNTASPANLVRTRRRAFRPSERLARHHRDRPLPNFAPTAAAFTRPASPLPEPPDPYGDREHRSRAKRRKLDDGGYDNEKKLLPYGYKGQVVPGPLRLEIESCDGGEYQDPSVQTTSWPSNVLKDDATVYCTKSNRCNLLLRHVGGMPFTLTKIVVKAPRSGYDAPIQEGMIFVAMSDDDILEKTSHFEMHYAPRSYRQHRHHFERTRARPEYANSARSPLRSIDRTRYLRNPNAMPGRFDNDPFLESAVIPGFDITTGPPSDDEAPPTSPPSPRPWHYNERDDAYQPYVDRYRPQYHEPVSLTHGMDDNSDRSSDSEDLSDHLAIDAAEMAAVLNEMGDHGPDARRILRNTRRDARYSAILAAARNNNHASRTEEDTDSDVPSLAHATASSGPSMTSRHQLPASTTGYDRLGSDAEGASGKYSGEGDKTIVTADAPLNGSDMVAPHARFYIPRSKSSVSIKFDPPVAGTYILIKLWAPCPNANIDVESIIAHGYGGPRFFPAIEMR